MVHRHKELRELRDCDDFYFITHGVFEGRICYGTKWTKNSELECNILKPDFSFTTAFCVPIKKIFLVPVNGLGDLLADKLLDAMADEEARRIALNRIGEAIDKCIED